eukprot:5159837-Heterocapsa_arctica.AAC.1
MKLQIDVRAADCRAVMSALLQSEELMLANVHVYKNVFRSSATAPSAHRSSLMLGIRQTPDTEWGLLMQ